MSGVICATHVELRGMMPPENKPKSMEKATMVGNVVILIQSSVIIPVRKQIRDKMLNLPNRSPNLPARTRPNTEPP